MFWNRAIESTSKLCPVCEECRAVERWPFEELGLLNNNYRRTLAAPSVLFHTYMTAVQTAQLHIPHTLSFTLLSLYSNALIDTYICMWGKDQKVFKRKNNKCNAASNCCCFSQNKSFFISFRFNLIAILFYFFCANKYHAFSPDLQKTAGEM